MIDRAFLALAVFGLVACVGVHVGAFLGFPADFGVTFALMGGCLLVFGRAIGRARAVFRTVDAKSLWNAVTTRAAWLKYTFHPLVLYFGVFWAWALYVAFVQGSSPTPKHWALFYSAGAGSFYVVAAAFLWASIQARSSQPQK
jgi:hypothetical protein